MTSSQGEITQTFLHRPIRFIGRRSARNMPINRAGLDGSEFSSSRSGPNLQIPEIQDRSSRAHYNRLVGEIVQDEFNRQRRIAWTLRETELMSNFFAIASEDMEFTVRAKIQDILKFVEPPNLDLLRLPDKNEF